MLENYKPGVIFTPLGVDQCYGPDLGLNPFGRRLQRCFVLFEDLTVKGITPVRKEEIGKEVNEAVIEVIAMVGTEGLTVGENGDLSLGEKTAIIQNWKGQWPRVVGERNNMIYQRCKTKE